MTYRRRMSRAKIAVRRSQALKIVVKERRDPMQSRLVRESDKLDRAEEQALANEVYAGECAWPEY
jgi:hypothetical protein